MHDFSEAFDECRRAADQGDLDAQFQLGLMYGLGLGVSQSYTQALKWYRWAAQKGSPKAQVNLGYLYGTGRGVPQDYVEAYAWYSIAASSGDETARNNREIVASEMSPNQLERAQALSKELFEDIGADEEEKQED